MRRRQFITLLGGAIAAWPLATSAQQPAKVHRIGFLGTFPLSDPLREAFAQGLRHHGYIEGQNLHIEYRYHEGKADRLPDLAADLIRLGVSLIVAGGPAASRAAKDATTSIPIVFVGVADPVGLGLIASLARPGGNVTGFTSLDWENFAGKALQLLKEAVPKSSRIAILINPTNPMHARVLPRARMAAETLGVTLQILEARAASDLEGAFEAATRERADALDDFGDPVFFGLRGAIVELALKHRLPTIHFFRETAEAGGLMSYGPNWSEILRNVGRCVDKILKGAAPADIPAEQPTIYELVINLKTARALGLEFPPSIVIQATEVIE